MFAPKDIEIAWTKTEDKLADFLEKKKWHKAFLFFASLIIAYFSYGLWAQNSFPPWSRFNLVQDRLWATYVLIFLSFIPLFIHQLRHSVLFLLFAVSIAWLFPIYKIDALSLNAIAPIIYLVACAVIVNIKFLARFLKAALIVLLFLGLVSWVTRNAILSENSKLILYFSNLHLDLLLLYFIGSIFNKKPFPNSLHFNPLQLIAPSPLPEQLEMKNNSSYEKQFIKGMLGIFNAQFIFVFLIFLLTQDAIARNTNPLLYYCVFILTIVAAMKMVSSLLWIYGIKTVSATYFLILAKSPIEVWQRGSVFVADFLFNKIYLPIWKRSRSITLAAIATVFSVLVHVFVFHEMLIKTLLRYQFGDFLFGSFGLNQALQWGIWVAIWLVWILIFSIFLKTTKPLHSISVFQWILVFLTHIGSALVFPIVFQLSTIIRI